MSQTKRISIDVDGPGHKSPIPSAARIGNFMMTGHIYGRDPATNEMASGAEAQVKMLFANLKAILAAGGATAENVLKLEFKVQSLDIRPLINRQWSEMFPDAASLPARHVERFDHLASPAVVSCEACVVIS